MKSQDRLTVTKPNTISKLYKQDYKSKLMMEKQLYKECQRNIWILRYKLLTPLDPQILNIQRNPILVPVDTPLLVIRKHIPRQSDIDKIVTRIS